MPGRKSLVTPSTKSVSTVGITASAPKPVVRLDLHQVPHLAQKKSDEQSSGRSDSRPKDCRFYRGAQQGSAGRAINVTAAQPNNVVYSTRAPFIGRRGATAGRQAAINCGHGRRSAHIRRNSETRLPCVKTGSEQARKNLLFDHLVGAGEQDGWNSEAERLRGL
jgi:hypothetical protein